MGRVGGVRAVWEGRRSKGSVGRVGGVRAVWEG